MGRTCAVTAATEGAGSSRLDNGIEILLYEIYWREPGTRMSASSNTVEGVGNDL